MMLQRIRNRKQGQKGFTIIELMIVIAIIGILAAIAIPNFIQYRKNAYNAAAKSDAKNAYTAGQAYFNNYLNFDGEVTLEKIRSAGFNQTAGVDVTVDDGTIDEMAISAIHTRGDVKYTGNKAGVTPP
jgi:prepilin-type N-terminal cleavage/methylation domain-containing protein